MNMVVKKFFKKNTARRTLTSGLTLIEMLVVIAIVMIVAAILLFRYADFSSNVSIRGLAQQVALMIRKGQSYATSVRTADIGTFSTDQFASYGLSFSTAAETPQLLADTQPSQKRFVLFADIQPSNTLYTNTGKCGNAKAGKECVEAFTITSSDIVKGICAQIGVGSSETCTYKGVNILFHRPIPDATFCLLNDAGATSCAAGSASYVKVELMSAKGLEKDIYVWNTGQISVQ